MPNYDGGHYFLTALSPVLAEPDPRLEGSFVSPTAALREALASLPTAQQSEASVKIGHRSPFSRCDRTHFARLAVIDQPAFNGRDPGDAIVQSFRMTDLLAHRPVDSLTRAWLLLGIDFDPGEQGADGLRGYLERLWGLMGAELADIYRHCHGFRGVESGRQFADYILRCQIETTMPFNDYWTGPPPLPAITMKGVGRLVLGLFALFVLLAFGLTRLAAVSGWWTLAAAPFAAALAVWIALRHVGARGDRLFPIAPDSDLRSVLKALHVQQRFADFAADQQGRDAAALHAAFGAFVEGLRPGTVEAPTQAPGVVRS